MDMYSTKSWHLWFCRTFNMFFLHIRLCHIWWTEALVWIQVMALKCLSLAVNLWEFSGFIASAFWHCEFIITSKASVFSTLLLFLWHVSLNDTRAAMNPKLFFDLDPNPNEVACRNSDPNPTIHENVYLNVKKKALLCLKQYCYLPLVGIWIWPTNILFE